MLTYGGCVALTYADVLVVVLRKLNTYERCVNVSIIQKELKHHFIWPRAAADRSLDHAVPPTLDMHAALPM
jgi:hypothetical protein